MRGRKGWNGKEMKVIKHASAQENNNRQFKIDNMPIAWNY